MVAVRFVGYDEGHQTLALYDTRGELGWCLSLAEMPLARDLQLLEGGRILVGFDRGYFEVDAVLGTIVDVVDRWSGVTSVRRLENGDTVVAGVDLTAIPGITLLTVAPHGKVTAVTRPGDYVRLVRPTPQNTWLLGADERFLETTPDLVEVRQLAAPGFRHAWLALRLPDGGTLVSAGYGAFLARFDASGRLERIFGGSADVPPEVEPFFYASFERLADGGLLVANWQGHGADSGAKGRQLIEFAADGTYVDSMSFSSVSSLQGILVVPGNNR